MTAVINFKDGPKTTIEFGGTVVVIEDIGCPELLIKDGFAEYAIRPTKPIASVVLSGTD